LSSSSQDIRFQRSNAHQERARRSLAGGVSTAFRAAQKPVPICFARGRDARLFDLDGNEYIDYALGFGPMLLGHSPRAVVKAARRQAQVGLGYGACHEGEAELAEALVRTVPCAELCVISNTGSEAVHAAIRIARSATGRNRVVKFLGHYHGWLDSIQVGNPGQVDGSVSTGGQDPGASASVTVCPWNDLEVLERELADGEVAAVITEPLNVNGGCIAPGAGYLPALRDLTRRYDSALIFDEVITGFRVALGGAQALYGVVPDLAVFGKAMGGGFPISAVCGSAALMDEVVSGRVAHVGTFNANPVAAAAAVAAIGELEQGSSEIYPELARKTETLVEILKRETAAAGLDLAVNHAPGVAHAFVSPDPVDSYLDSLSADRDRYALFAEMLLREGVQIIPRGLLYVSTAHSDLELDQTEDAVRRAAALVASQPLPAS